MNPFVQYLDQYNVLSPSHANIYDEYTQSSDPNSFAIRTRIEGFLLSQLAERPRSFIMTGNAGDGKTRLCRIVYEELTGQPLQQWPDNGIVDVPFPHGTLRIVKDLSELTDAVIYEELSSLNDQIASGYAGKLYYLIAANEGKLTKSLSQHDSLKELAEKVKMRFLDHTGNDDQLHLVNLQDVTSSIYAGRILEEWNQEKHWAACESCAKAPSCIIRLNHRRLSQPVVHNRLIEQYRLLDCLGIHATMREILIHLSYALTGGLTCGQVLNADYRAIEEQADKAYYNNFYGIGMADISAGELGAIRHFRRLDPGRLSISSIDDYLLNGDISGEPPIARRHERLFDEEIDLLFGYYRQQIEVYRGEDPDRSDDRIFARMPQFRRKYFFEADEEEQATRQKLVSYQHFYRFLQCLTDQKAQSQVRRELIQGLNHAFSKKLMDRTETQLFAVNEHLLIHAALSPGQVRLAVDTERQDIDYLPSRLLVTANQQAQQSRLEVKLPVFEYLLRLAGGGLFVTLKQEAEILLSTFRNDLINRSEMDPYSLQVLSMDPAKGVYVRYEIDI